MRIAVLGAGAMGSVFGGRLSLAGHDVTLVDVWREHVEAVARTGLALEAPDGPELWARPRATYDPSDLTPVDAVIVLTKGFATREAAATIAHAVTPQTAVVTLQNGLGLDVILGEVFGLERVVSGTTTVGAEMVAPGCSRMTPLTASGQAVTHIGRPRSVGGGVGSSVEQLAVALSEADLPTEIHEDVDRMIWTKLAMAASMAPTCSILGCRIGQVWEDEGGRALIRTLFDEIVAVAAAEGVELDVEGVWEHCASTWDNCTEHHPSMTIDILKGRRTEIDSFSLEIARRAAAHGVPAGACETVGRLVELTAATRQPAAGC